MITNDKVRVNRVRVRSSALESIDGFDKISDRRCCHYRSEK